MPKSNRPWEEEFLAALETTGILSHAAKAVGIPRRTVYDHKKADRAFYQKCKDALETAADNFEMEAMRRAMEGEKRPVYYKGQVVDHMTKHDNAMLMFVLKNMRQWQQRELQRDRSLVNMLTDKLE